MNQLTVEITPDQAEQLYKGEVNEVRLPVSETGPNTTPLDEAELDMVIDVMGIVRTVEDINTFQQSNGEEGQVRNIHIQDSTAIMRCALWGEKADLDITPGDAIHIVDAEVQDGWQTDLELSAGWSSAADIIDADEYESEIEFVNVRLTGSVGMEEDDG